MNGAALQMTKHAEQRAVDRSIPEVARRLLLDFASPQRAGKGAVSYSFDKKAWREVERFLGTWPLKKMDQLKRVYMVMSDDGAVITLAYRD